MSSSQSAGSEQEPIQSSSRQKRSGPSPKRSRRASPAGASLARWQDLIDALPHSIAVLDERGLIVQVNQAWRDFGQANGAAGDYVGTNYLSVCDQARGALSREAPLAAAGIRDVIAGRGERFALEYPCHTPWQRFWFALDVRPLAAAGPARVLAIHENTTARVTAERETRAAHRRLMFAREEELHRLARELHDNMGQQMFGLQLAIGHASQGVREQLYDQVHERLAEALKLSNQIIEQVRNLAYMLYPPTLASSGLAPAVQSLLDKAPGLAELRLNCDPRLHGARLAAEVEIALFRIVQEGVCNALRHSQASRVDVDLAYRDGQVLLTVTDDGVGFDTAEHSTGLGLSTMRERSKAIGGQFDVRSRPGETRLMVAVAAEPEHIG